MNNFMMAVKKLLEKVENVIKQNEELSALKGENFNVFQIFDMESDENKMHSRFINTLIDPKGRHGRGTIFLELFLESIGMSSYFDNLENVCSKVEHSIGMVKIDGKKSIGGRIDIFIWDKKKSISIENKVYASDQEMQIVRYSNYHKGNNAVFYLTLYGSDPLKNNNTINDELSDFYCISYSDTILDWLEKCQKEASDFPIIRETIKQYIITIKRLTNQLTNQRMTTDINNLIIENYESACAIANNLDKAKLNLVDTFLDEFKQLLKNELGDSWIIEKEDIKKSWSRIKIFNKDWPENTAITLQGQPFFSKSETIIGLPSHRKSDMRKRIEYLLNNGELEEIRNYYTRSSKCWIFYCAIFNFEKQSEFSVLLSKELKKEFISSITQKTVELAHILKDHLKVKYDNK